MTTYAKVILSGSTNGRPIPVAADTTPGTLIHTVDAGSFCDELWLYVANTAAGAVKLTIELGGVTAPDDLIEDTIPPEGGLVLIIPGLPINNGVLVRAFADTADLLNIVGWVNRITV